MNFIMFKKILVPIDGSEISKKATHEAVKIAKKLNSTIVLTHIMDQLNLIPYEEQESEAQKIIDEMLKYVKDENVHVETMLLFGSPEYDIEKVARKSEADIMIIGTYGRTGLTSEIMGSFTQAAIKHVNIPILLIK